MASRVFVTGGSGFVGSRLLPALRARGYRVTALDRSGALQRRVTPGPDLQVITGDLLDPSAYRDALAGSDVVLHLAATTGRASRETHFRVNAEGTEVLLEACRHAGLSRILFVSSIATTFDDTRDYHYAQAKIRAERAVEQSGLAYAILRPTMILGAGSPILVALEKLALLPVVPVFGTGRTRVQPVHVDDVVRAILAVLDDDGFTNTAIDVGGPTVLTIEALLQRIRTARRGRAGRVLHVPLGLVLPPLRLAETVGLGGLLPLSPGQLSSFRSDGIVRADALPERLHADLADVAAMLEPATAAPGPMPASLEQECDVFTRYVVGRPPTEYVSAKYAAALAALPALSATTRLDAVLLSVARRRPVLTRLADAYARLAASESALRCRLVVLLAILETCPPFYRAVDAPAGGPVPLAALRLAWRGSVAGVTALVALLLFTPARLVLGAAGRRPR